MEKRQLFLYPFFSRLRKEAGIELDMRQYVDFLKVFPTTGPFEDVNDLLELCKIHWLTQRKFEREFEKIFREEFRSYVRIQPREASEEKQPEVRAERESTQTEKKEIQPTPVPPSPPPPEPAPLPTARPEPEETQNSIFLQFNEGAGSGGGSKIEEAGRSYLDNDFIFSDKYLPASDRRMKQNWRYLKSAAEKYQGQEPDLPGIVESVARNGFFHEPVFLPSKAYRHHIFFLIDHGGSMSAFDTLSDRLVSTIRESLRPRHASTLYFHNYPGERLFLDAYHTRSTSLPELLSNAPRQSSLFFIISDGGAARGRVHSRRIDETRTFLKKLKNRIPRVLWLNPMPEERWAGSSAAYLSFFVDMIEASERGFRRLPEKLKHL